MTDFIINYVGLYEFERDSDEVKSRGIMPANELDKSNMAKEICQKMVSFLWMRPINHNSTFSLRFQSTPLTGKGWPQECLREINRGVEPEPAAGNLAQAMAGSGWTVRYAMVLIGFTWREQSFSALIFTPSATSETYAVEGEGLIRELNNIYNRRIAKGVIYPFFDHDEDKADDGRAKVYQHVWADFFPRRLGLEIQPSPTRLAAQVVDRVLGDDANWVGAQGFASSVMEAASDPNLEIDPAEAKMVIEVGNVEVVAPLFEYGGGSVEVKADNRSYHVHIRGTSGKVRLGEKVFQIERLATGEDDPL